VDGIELPTVRSRKKTLKLFNLRFVGVCLVLGKFFRAVFMVLELESGALQDCSGMVKYRSEFRIFDENY